MAGIRPKQLARLGEFHLEEAVLDVLLDAKHEDECLWEQRRSVAGLASSAKAAVAAGMSPP